LERKARQVLKTKFPDNPHCEATNLLCGLSQRNMVNNNYVVLIVGVGVAYGFDDAKQCAKGWAREQELHNALPEGGCVTSRKYDQLGYLPDWSYAFYYNDE